MAGADAYLRNITSSLRVYLAEFSIRPDLHAVIQPRVGNDGELFTVAAILNMELLKGEVMAHLIRAEEDSCHVLVFPELCIPPDFLVEIKEWLDAKELKNLKLVIAGSFHELDGGEGDGVFVNRCHVLLANGSELTELQQDKLLHLSLPSTASLNEDIRCALNVSLVSSSIGCCSVAICLDLAQSLTPAIAYERLPIVWLWVPSMSKKTEAHLDHAKKLFLAQGTRSLCSNQSGISVNGTSALRPENEAAIHTSFAYYSTKSVINRSIGNSSSAEKSYEDPFKESLSTSYRIYDAPLPERSKQS